LIKLLHPEVVIEINKTKRANMNLVVSEKKFEELRCQVTFLLRYTKQIKCIRYPKKKLQKRISLLGFYPRNTIISA
jgi:hypothetical protein